jgi:xylulokinase
VYWKIGAENILQNLKSSNGFLHSQLGHSFSISDSPVWMDSSTGRECEQLEDAVGGAHALADITGTP